MFNAAPIIKPVPWAIKATSRLIVKNMKNLLTSNGWDDMKYIITEKSIQQIMEIGTSIIVIAV